MTSKQLKRLLDESSVIHGTILTPSSAVLPGATVSLNNTKTGLVRTEVTDDHWRYLTRANRVADAVEQCGWLAHTRASGECRADAVLLDTSVNNGCDVAVSAMVV